MARWWHGLGRRRKKGDLSVEGSVTRPKFQELSLNGLPDSGNAQLEVALPDGVVLRGAQASQLAELVQLLRA